MGKIYQICIEGTQIQIKHIQSVRDVNYFFVKWVGRKLIGMLSTIAQRKLAFCIGCVGIA